MLLSFIIPLYNAEAYIGKCLDSILNSDIEKNEYEVIVIDDGSKDKGLSVARQYEQQYDNIRVLTQTNQGQSVARNYGIREAKGKYIWCIDSDDYTDSKFLVFLDLLQSHPSLDIIALQLSMVRENGEKVGLECDQPTVAHNVIMKGREAILKGYNPSSVCALIIRRTLMEKNNLYFYEGITHQDVELSYRLMAHAGDVIFTDYAPYIYVLHPNSTSQSINPQKKIKYLSDEIIIMRSFTKLADELNTSDPELSAEILKRVKNIHFGMVLNLHNVKKQFAPLGINAAVLQNMKDAGLYPIRTDLGNWKKNLFKHILNFEWFVK